MRTLIAAVSVAVPLALASSAGHAQSNDFMSKAQRMLGQGQGDEAVKEAYQQGWRDAMRQQSEQRNDRGRDYNSNSNSNYNNRYNRPGDSGYSGNGSRY